MSKSEFVRMMESCRRAYERAFEKEQKLFDALDRNFSGLDLEDCPSNAENADSVKDAIACYFQYGEYDPEEIWGELQMGYYAHQ